MTTAVEVSLTSNSRPAVAAFHLLRVSRVVPETADARSYVLHVPDELFPAFDYRAGQFVTLRLTIDGERHLRSYSMSSSPLVDGSMQVTVKRTPGGVVSNWLLDTVEAGDLLEVSVPTGRFVLGATDRPIVAFAAGSGITPVFSLLKAAVSGAGPGTRPRPVRLLYANRDSRSVIFDAELAALAERHPDLLSVTHHLDDVHGLVTERHVRDLHPGLADAECYVCGPGPFMDVVEDALRSGGVPPDRLHIERFTPDSTDPELTVDTGWSALDPVSLTVELNGKTATVTPRPGASVLQSARSAGLKAPSSCETGSCATCIARLVDGHAEMRNNEVLTDTEVAEGWLLTCQAVPVSPTVHVIYE